MVVLWLTLPRSDGAHGQSLANILDDPFVMVIGATIAAVCVIIVLPAALFCPRNDHWFRNGLISVGVVLTYILITTPISPAIDVCGSPVVAILALLVIKHVVSGK